MYIQINYIIAMLVISISSAGCTNITQRNIDDSQFAYSNSNNGVIVGSVTAPFAAHYHETILFEYRKPGDGDKYNGVMTSGMQHKNFLIGIPACTEGGIPEQCGRLFATSLPAGNYEIFRANVLGRGEFEQLVPAGFTVRKGKASYLGNLHVTFCKGMVSRYRGNILGANVAIRDEYERDIALIRKYYGALTTASIDKRLLPDNSWMWRVSWQAPFRGNVEPYDWGECGGPLLDKTFQPTPQSGSVDLSHNQRIQPSVHA
jgi:hypothetical protein